MVLRRPRRAHDAGQVISLVDGQAASGTMQGWSEEDYQALNGHGLPNG